MRPLRRPPLPARAARAPAAWRRRLDSLRTKLFLAIALANMGIVLVVVALYSWSFDRSLEDYLNRTDDARLAPLVARLQDGYAQHGSWEWLRQEKGALHALLHEALGPHDSAQGPAKPAWIEGQLFLEDAQHQPVVGVPDDPAEAWRIPLQVRGQAVGYLGRMPRHELVESLEQVSAARQRRLFAVIALAMLAAVALNAALIARWLGRRLAWLGAAATEVAQGNYGVRLPSSGRDELERLAADFNQMAAALEAAQGARQRWVADIAHELRTPLATLLAEVEAMQDGIRQPTPQRLDSLAQELHRMTRLIGDLRTLSLSDLGALDYRFAVRDLGALVGDYLQDNALPGGWQLDTALEAGLRVRLDADRWVQVLANLWQNTLRYTDAPGRLRVALQRDAGQAVLCWEDSAPGVPADALPRLTERLFRVDASRAQAGGGSGLGLAITQAIVQAHGGSMQASASVLGGLRWDIRLPLEDA